MSHADYLRSTSAREAAEYRALELLEPPIGDRIDTGFATLAWIIHSMLKSAEADSTTIADWTPDYAARFRDDPAKEDQLSDEFDQWYERMMEQGE